MKSGDWVRCQGEGYRHEHDGVAVGLRTFKENSVGQIRAVGNGIVTVWFIGNDETWDVIRTINMG